MNSIAEAPSRTQRRSQMSRRCDRLWNSYKQWWVIEESNDERAYACGGMWIHPCGKTFQEGGRDGFTKDLGNEHCNCDLCSEFRREFLQ